MCDMQSCALLGRGGGGGHPSFNNGGGGLGVSGHSRCRYWEGGAGGCAKDIAFPFSFDHPFFGKNSFGKISFWEDFYQHVFGKL